MWLDRLLGRLKEYPGPVLIEGGEAYGAPFLIEALGRTRRVAWMHLTPTEASDFVAIGNRLADAVNRALEANFLPHALPFNYATELLKKRLPFIEPLTLVCSNVDYVPRLRDSLLDLAAAGTKVILITSGSASVFQAGLHLRQAELALTPDEAETLAGHRLSSSEKYMLWRSSGGAYLTFMSSVCRLLDVPLPHVPSPQGSLVVPGSESLVSPDSLLEVLQKLGRHTEALELAVMKMPERVEELIGEAGPMYHEQGLLKRLHELLESLDAVYQHSEKVLEWRLVAGFTQSNYVHLMPTVEAYLRNNEAPELRARYAGVIPELDKRFAEAQRAVAAAATPLTLYQLGRIHPNAEKGYELLRRSLKLAEASKRPYEIARNANALADSLNYQGKFHEAASWSDWALQTFDQGNVNDGSGRLRILCVRATARINMGQISGLREIFLEARDACKSAELYIATDVRIVLANLEFILGNLQEAEQIATENFQCDERWRLGELAVPLVRILLEQGKLDEALEKAQYAVALTEGEDDFHSLPASLALGMVYAFTSPDAARSYLVKVLEADDIEMTFRIMAALHLLKTGALHFTELTAEMQESLRMLTPTALHLFCGPESALTGALSSFATQHAPLRIKVLGQREVRLNGKPIQLGERALETLVLLALYPDGLTPEMLHSYLYENDDVKLVALRAAVSRLRSIVPVSTYPDLYRITVPFTFDARDCEQAVTAGDIKAALELYRGALLEKSTAPGIVDARRFLEERLRQCVLHSHDVEALLPLAETLRDDLELWQATHKALPTNDARLPNVRAQLQRVTQGFGLNYN